MSTKKTVKKTTKKTAKIKIYDNSDAISFYLSDRDYIDVYDASTGYDAYKTDEDATDLDLGTICIMDMEDKAYPLFNLHGGGCGLSEENLKKCIDLGKKYAAAYNKKSKKDLVALVRSFNP
jgi:hypothetical protein